MGWALDLWRSNAILALGVVLFLGGLGVPGPATLAIVATGSLVRHGGISPVVASLVGLSCAAVGDLISYGLARRGFGRWVERRKRRPSWQRAVERFHRNAPLTLFLARWLVTPLSLPATYIAGSSRYPVRRFLAASLLGQTVWILSYGTLGYLLGNRWQGILEVLERYGAWIAIMIVLIGLVLWSLKRGRPHPQKRVEKRM